MRRSLGILLSATLVTCLLAIPGAAGAQTPAPGGTLVVAWGFDPKTLNVAWQWDHGAAYISQLLYDPLVRMDITGQVHPALARSWDISADAKTYTFHLADNIKWHDGTKFTAADVKWTLETIQAQKGPATNGLAFKSIAEISTPNDTTVVMRLNAPAPRLLQDLYGDQSTGAILPKHVFDGTDVQKNERNTKPIGTGPFKFVEHVSADRLTLEANKEYFLGRPYLDRVVFKMVPDARVALAALESGEAHYMYPRPPFSEVQRLRNVPGVKVEEFFGAYTWWIEFNEKPETLSAPLRSESRVKVRQAIAGAIDKDDINTKVLLGFGKPARGAVAARSPFFNADVAPPAFDAVAAERTLDQLGFPRGADGMRFPMEIMIIAGWEGGAADSMANVIKEQLGKVGIAARLKTVDAATSFSDRQTGKWDSFLASTNQGPDPDQLSAQTASTGFANWRGYSNPRVDELFQLGGTTPDPEARKKAYNELQGLLVNDLSQLNLVESPRPYTYRDEFQGWFFQNDTLSNDPDLRGVYWTRAGAAGSVAADQGGAYLLAGVAAVVVLGGGALYLRRRSTRKAA